MWKYIKSILFAVAVFLFFEICFGVVQVGGVIGFHTNPYRAILTATNKEAVTHFATQISIFAICADIFIVICAAIIIQIFTTNKFKKIIKPVKFEKRKLRVVIPVGIGCSLVVSIIAALIAAPFFKDPQITKLFGHMTTPISVIGTVIVAPIAEEIIFRGILFNFINKRTKNVIFAIIISSVTFGIAHGNGDQGVYATLLGVFLALIYLYTGSIFGDILVHMIANGVTVLQTVILANATGVTRTKVLIDIGWVHILLGIAVFLFAWYFFKKQKYGKIKKGFFRGGVTLSAICLVFVLVISILPNKQINKMQAKVNSTTKVEHVKK